MSHSFTLFSKKYNVYIPGLDQPSIFLKFSRLNVASVTLENLGKFGESLGSVSHFGWEVKMLWPDMFDKLHAYSVMFSGH